MTTCVTNRKSGNEPSWVLEYERQERRKATEMRKREMEERIARLREKERREKLAAKRMNGRVVKKRVCLEACSCRLMMRKKNRLSMTRVSFSSMNITRTMRAMSMDHQGRVLEVAIYRRTSCRCCDRWPRNLRSRKKRKNQMK